MTTATHALGPDTTELLIPLRPPVTRQPFVGRRRPSRLRRLVDAADLVIASVLILFAVAAAVLFAGPFGFFIAVFLFAQAAIALHPPVWRLATPPDDDTTGGAR